MRMDSSLKPSPSLLRVTEIAKTASATAISSRLGSKMIFSPADMTSSVTGGRTCDGAAPTLTPGTERERGYTYSAASQSSSKNGSSSPWDLNFGNLVDKSAR